MFSSGALFLTFLHHANVVRTQQPVVDESVFSAIGQSSGGAICAVPLAIAVPLSFAIRLYTSRAAIAVQLGIPVPHFGAIGILDSRTVVAMQLAILVAPYLAGIHDLFPSKWCGRRRWCHRALRSPIPGRRM